MTKKDKAALKPCPFCKSEPELIRRVNDFTKRQTAIIKCTKPGCTCEMRVGVIRQSYQWAVDRVIEKWNTRATLAPAVVEPVSGAVPVGYIYEYDGQPGCGVHRSLKNEFWNGQYADRSIPYYIAAPEPEKNSSVLCESKTDLKQQDETEHAPESDQSRRVITPEPEKAQGDDAMSDKELRDWIFAWSQNEGKIPLESDTNDLIWTVQKQSSLTERREPPADLSLDDDLLETIWGVAIDSPELNPSNYDHEQVCELNRAMCYICSILKNSGRISGVSKEGEE